MRTAQKIIKAFAICLASFIIVVMLAAVVGVISLTGTLFGVDFGFSNEIPTSIWQDENNTEVRKLDISTGATHLRLIRDSSIKQPRVETNNKYISTRQDGETLRITEESHFSFFLGVDGRTEVKVYLPEKIRLTDIEIDTGAGKVDIEYLKTERLRLELGAGLTEIAYVEATERAEIESGAGALEIRDGKLKDLNLKHGAGKCSITASILGTSKLDAGVGRVELSLTGAEKDYRFVVDKGIGTVTINHNSVEDDEVYGSGDNLIKLESGVGSVEIETLGR